MKHPINRTYSIDGKPCTVDEFNEKKAWTVIFIGTSFVEETFDMDTKTVNSDCVAPEKIFKTVDKKG